jgi:hypothetical protein
MMHTPEANQVQLVQLFMKAILHIDPGSWAHWQAAQGHERQQDQQTTRSSCLHLLLLDLPDFPRLARAFGFGRKLKELKSQEQDSKGALE